MASGPRLDLRTSQTLVLSPQLQAAIKLLTLSNLDLQAEIATELDSNPLLELADDQNIVATDAASENLQDREQGRSEEADTSEKTDTSEKGVDDELGAGADGSDLDVDLDEERFHHDCLPDRAGGSGEGGNDFLFEQFPGPEASLIRVLERQVEQLDPAEWPVARAIIGSIDAAGYLVESLAEIAARLAVEEAEVARVLTIVQGFEPTGVGARTLSECIALQAQAADRYDPYMAALIDNLDVVARGDLAALRRICDVDAEDLADMLRELRFYDPKPGLQHGGGSAAAIVPDVFVRRAGKSWVVELNSSTLPQVVVNRRYRAKLMEGMSEGRRKPPKQERQFISQCYSQGNWLVKALEQRASTILRVATALAEHQRGFFEHGVQHLKPLTLKVIAEVVGVHESTVSRVVSNKYLSCERGIFELKYFFTTSIANADGSESSAESVRQRIKELIDEEPPLKPLSDDRIAEMLREEGHDIARRTVAKYREALGIVSSFNRRRRALLEAG